jgi:hypothetical protein
VAKKVSNKNYKFELIYILYVSAKFLYGGVVFEELDVQLELHAGIK